MKFTIVVPVYNVEKYLPECVSSVLCQSFEDYEIILVDDGSTDGSGKLCDQYAEKDSRIKVIHQSNQGQAAARNAGIKVAEGDYLLFFDADDLYEQGDLLKEIAQATPGADAVVFNWKEFQHGHDTGLQTIFLTCRQNMRMVYAIYKRLLQCHYTRGIPGSMHSVENFGRNMISSFLLG